jgi:hypothetical protein
MTSQAREEERKSSEKLVQKALVRVLSKKEKTYPVFLDSKSLISFL